MADWIERLAEAKAEARRASIVRQELRLHNARIIGARLPALWNTITEVAEANSAELRQRFPEEKKWHCHLVRDGLCFALINDGPLPRIELYIRPNLGGQCLDSVESIKSSMMEPASTRRHDRINVTVSDTEELEFHYKGVTHTTPESLARALISHTCNIPA